MKKNLIIASILLFVILLALGFSILNRRREFQENERYLMIKLGYATNMAFSIDGDYSMWGIQSEFEYNRRNPNTVDYTEIVFVYSLEEADSFGEHVLVAWPSRAPHGEPTSPVRLTQGVLAMYVWRIRENHPDVDFRDYGLPADEITMVDVVDNWEIVYELTQKYGRPRP